MTCLEKFKIEHPNHYPGRCPHNYGYADRPKLCYEMSCKTCWNREVQEDSSRFEGGDKSKDAVR